MVKRVLVPIADGSEELETISITDTLFRAGAEVVVAKVSKTPGKSVVCRSKAIISANVLLDEVVDQEFDCIALPGGLDGAKCFAESEQLIKMLKKQKESGKLYAAICATPAIVFAKHGLFEGKTKATAYPSLQDQLTGIDEKSKANRVVVDGNCITSQGPCTAVEFALEIVKLLYGEDKAKEVGKGMLFQ